MNIQNKVSELLTYYVKTRQAGHTTAALNGVTSTPGSVLVVSDGQREPKCGVPLSKLVGRQGPIVLDNFFVHELLVQVGDEFRRLESERHAADIKATKASAAASRLEILYSAEENKTERLKKKLATATRKAKRLEAIINS